MFGEGIPRITPRSGMRGSTGRWSHWRARRRLQRRRELQLPASAEAAAAAGACLQTKPVGESLGHSTIHVVMGAGRVSLPGNGCVNF